MRPKIYKKMKYNNKIDRFFDFFKKNCTLHFFKKSFKVFHKILMKKDKSNNELQLIPP